MPERKLTNREQARARQILSMLAPPEPLVESGGRRGVSPGPGPKVPTRDAQFASLGRELDASTPTVNGNGKLAVDVNAPKGVSVKAEGEGVFNKTETNRQMEPMAE
jgi:hypothetical protein